MNFLTEVLSTAQEAQVTNFKEKIPKLVNQINKLKNEVNIYMSNMYVEFNLMHVESNNFLGDSSKLNSEMNDLTENIGTLINRDVEAVNVDLDNLKTKYEESLYALKLIDQLVTIDNKLTETKQHLAAKHYLDAVTNLKDISKIFNDMPADECLDIIEALKVSVSIEHESILNDVHTIWNECVVTDKKIVDNDVILTLKINTSRTNEFKECLKTIYFDNVFVFQCLANFLNKELFTSIINHNCNVDVTDNEIKSVLVVTVKKNAPKQNYQCVFDHLQSVIDFISSTINFALNDDLVLLGFIGKRINEQFCEDLIKNCLADTIPTTPEGLENYSSVEKEIENLNEFFIDCEFFDRENESILKYAKNVDVLFANKTCQIYMDTARSILKKDLHDMVQVGATENLDVNEVISSKCFISKNVHDYLDLVKKILDQAYTSSDMCAGRLIYTADQIVILYYKLIPEYHKKLLENIPQQVALFYNNCNYIAQELETINKYKNAGKSVLRDADFSSHTRQLRDISFMHFSNYIQSQIKQIEEILKESEFTKLGHTDKIDPSCEKSIRQCLRQLELLKTVWQKVLSYEIYNKTMGNLLNTFVEYLIKLVVGVEDISADNCTLLVEVYGIVKHRGPKLFTEPKEINLYVKHWYKFNELILLLNSSLSDINDRWADGKGPLAVEFKPEEVKGLIRALFQNTDRRSAVLARIF